VDGRESEKEGRGWKPQDVKDRKGGGRQFGEGGERICPCHHSEEIYDGVLFDISHWNCYRALSSGVPSETH